MLGYSDTGVFLNPVDRATVSKESGQSRAILAWSILSLQFQRHTLGKPTLQ
jgi:hypothetical protein